MHPASATRSVQLVLVGAVLFGKMERLDGGPANALSGKLSPKIPRSMSRVTQSNRIAGFLPRVWSARDEEAAKRLAERRRQEELGRQKKIAEDIRKAEEAEKKRQAELREQEHHKMLAFISIAQHWKSLDTAKEFLSYLAGRIENVGDSSKKDALMTMIAHLEAAFAKEEEAFGNIQGIMDFVENAKPPQQPPQQEPQRSIDNQRAAHPEYCEHSEPYAHIPPWKRYSWFRKKY